MTEGILWMGGSTTGPERKGAKSQRSVLWP